MVAEPVWIAIAACLVDFDDLDEYFVDGFVDDKTRLSIAPNYSVG
jgi:hypothetical protein